MLMYEFLFYSTIAPVNFDTLEVFRTVDETSCVLPAYNFIHGWECCITSGKTLLTRSTRRSATFFSWDGHGSNSRLNTPCAQTVTALTRAAQHTHCARSCGSCRATSNLQNAAIRSHAACAALTWAARLPAACHCTPLHCACLAPPPDAARCACTLRVSTIRSTATTPSFKYYRHISKRHLFFYEGRCYVCLI